jgi:hypothetical protein
MRYNSYRRLFYRNPVGTSRAAVLVVGVLAGLGFMVDLFQNEPVPYPITVHGDAAGECVHKLNESYTTRRNIEAHQICAGLPKGDDYYLWLIMIYDDPKIREGRAACVPITFNYQQLYDCLHAKRWSKTVEKN